MRRFDIVTRHSESSPASARSPILISITWRAISASLAFEPIVFVSRNISCVRNSSLRPLRFVGRHHRVELLQVAPQPHDLFGDVAALGEHADLADDVGRLDLHAQFAEQLVEPLGQPRRDRLRPPAVRGASTAASSAAIARALAARSPAIARPSSTRILSRLASASTSTDSISGHCDFDHFAARPSARARRPAAPAAKRSARSSRPTLLPRQPLELLQVALQHDLVEPIVLGRGSRSTRRLTCTVPRRTCWRTSALDLRLQRRVAFGRPGS